ncbi:response regulator transcription factor [Butyrivibrio fibrisolvens]|uniref:Stage 0 sporulation protein A homolog n=1 Tax=Butyrivibrio fibrisolvens TaxID=831 RepID=A0A317G6B2_BUTFI|nr:response regulator transcription factor [Butyrivibrio fibrisolvens]PWT27832.1 DNA-binding response regulator [Butyrivibrio fibrisolvens]
MKLLLVEDELKMQSALKEILKREGYDVTAVEDGESALSEILTGVYDAIVLDVMIPKLSGIEVARKTRANGIKTPILMLTAMSELDDKVNGLDSGADDYLTKPFMTKELLARLRALLRRNVQSTDGSLTAGDLSLDVQGCNLSCSKTSQTVRLSEKELRIMEYLISNQEQIVSREQIATKIWGFENEAEYNNVEVYISFTRKKLAFIGTDMEIKAHRGIGYRIQQKNG